MCLCTVCMHNKGSEQISYINVNAVGLKCSLERSKHRTALHFDIHSTHYKEESYVMERVKGALHQFYT